MTMKPTLVDTVTVAEFLSRHPLEIRKISSALRMCILDVAPDAVEKVRAGWGLIGYTLNQYFCAVFPRKDHVRLLFERGVELSDPDGLLEGDGRKTRYVRIYSEREVQRVELRELIVQAIILQE